MIEDLLIEFDEMGFAPTTPCSDPEKYAIEWREKVRTEFEHLEAENAKLTSKSRQLELVLFTVVRNFKVLPVGLSLGKTQKEITDMTLETIEEIKKAIDYNSVEKLIKEKKK